ncbi:hypothetical protein [Marinimicrobium locisalis]|uniref:hypothetical protein n=1 Tax=Marinimicrobium locisalis TaxID=546022 RepID=UPI0032214CFF
MSDVEIERAIYINLDDREDRRSHMEKLLSNAQWDYERLAATRLEQSPEDAGLQMLPRLKGHKGVASIWLSHERALERFASLARQRSGHTGAYILFEDDVKVLDSACLQNPLPLPDGLPESWEIVLLTPRFRWKDKVNVPPEYEGKYFVVPYEEREWVNLNEARAQYIVTGAHYVIFRNGAVVEKVLAHMKDRSLYDVDNFYVNDFDTFGVRLPEVTAGGFGSDHNYD